ncbi:MAG: hypothetical protein E7252_10010 [Lachnospira sp.]|nr:hypothetical protein [Lachnospira sp.]
MTFNDFIYAGEKATKKKNKIIKKLQKQKFLVNTYVVALPANEENLLDIYSAKMLLQPHYKDMPIHVVGVAQGYDEALELVRDIVDEVYTKTGSFKVSEFLKQ